MRRALLGWFLGAGLGVAHADAPVAVAWQPPADPACAATGAPALPGGPTTTEVLRSAADVERVLPGCPATVGWKRHALVRIEVSTATSVKVTRVRRAGKDLRVTLTHEAPCGGARPVERRVAIWLRAPAGIRRARVDEIHRRPPPRCARVP